MTEANFEPPNHPSALMWAALARGEIAEEEKNKYAQHLAQCRRCMAVYAEFVEQSLGEGYGAVPTAWVDHALTIPQASVGKRSRPRRINVKWAWGAVLASLLVLTMVLVTKSRTRDAIPDALQSALAADLRADSQGSLVYGDALPPEPRGVRGAGPNPSAETARLERLLEMYRERPRDPVIAYWLVSAYLANNELRNADAFLRESLSTYSSDSRFLNLAAILAYKENRLADAEGYLRTAMTMNRNATVLVNLALVRRQQGDETEAQSLLNEVQFRFPDSALSPYVRALAATSR